MNIKISKADIIWSYLGYILKFGSNLIILPMILRLLTKDEVGVWYAFTAVGSFVMLLDFGFSPTIMRNVSYSWGGATELQKEGFCSIENESDGPNYELLYKIIITSKKIYFYISTAALLLMLTIGSVYIHSISHGLLDYKSIIVAWIIYSLGCFLNLYYSYWTPLLNGIGAIKDLQIITIISQVFYLSIAFVGLILGWKLIAISIAYSLSGIVVRILAKRSFYKKNKIYSTFIKYKKIVKFKECKEILGIIWHNAYRQGLVTLGAYLIMQSNIVICSIFIDLETTASYGIALQLFSVLGSFSVILFRSYLPLFNEARLRNEREKLIEYFSVSVIISWVCYLLGGFIIIVFGNMALKLIGSQTPLLPKGVLAFMLFYLFLEYNHGFLFATFITTENKVPFVNASLFSGVCVVILSLLLVKLTGLGIWALLLSQCFIQLLYNNWKWPYVVLKELNIRLWDLFVISRVKFFKSINS